jgi:hypothetical protein
MSEHDDRYASGDLPRTTGEFRAAPDASASTAEFKAFVSNLDRDDNQRTGSGALWPEQPWAGESARTGSGRTLAIAVGVIVALAVIITLIVAVG